MTFKMKKQSFSILLILMMLITPIASAFDPCVGLDMSDHFSASQGLSADNTMPLEHEKMLNSSSNQMDVDCHNNASCSLHICGTYAISSFTSIINSVVASNYSIVEYTSSYSTVLPPDLRPPKFIL